MAGQREAVGRYQIRSELGAGGFATVYRAHDPVLDREVALKVLHQHLARDATVRERFVREGRALARVEHPNVVQVWDCGEADGTAYLAMRLIKGRPLEDIVKEHGPMPLADLVAVMDQAAAALAAVHAQHLIHRDIKPANIMVEDGSGRAMLLDLGVARDMSNATMTTGWIVGTPGYMAPEQVQAGGEVTPQTDVYQLGATAYALLTGRPPYEGDTIQVLDAIVRFMPPDLRAIRPDLSQPVIEAIGWAMAKDPNQRPHGTQAFAAALRAAASGASFSAPVAHPAMPPAGPPPGSQAAPRGMPAPAAPSGYGAAAGFQGAPTAPVQRPVPAAPGAAAKKSPLPLILGGVAAVVLLGAVAFFALGSGGGDDDSPTPVTTVAAQLRTPEETYEALLATPFDNSVLPKGYAATNVDESEPDEEDGKHNVVGVVSVGVTGGGTGAGNAIVYSVYQTEKDAKARYDVGVSAESNVKINSTFNPTGFSTPAQGITATYTNDDGEQSGVSYCIVLVKNTQVWGVSLLETDKQRGNNQAACDLARSGIAHLERVQAVK